MKKLLSVTVAAGIVMAALTASPKQAQAHTDFFLSLGFPSGPVIYAPPPPPPRVIYRPEPIYYYTPWPYYGYYHRDWDHDWDHHHWDHHDEDHDWDHHHH